MDNLAERLSRLNKYLDSVPNEDVEYFNEFYKEHMEKIGNTIDVLEAVLFVIKPADEKLKEIEIENIKYKIISKKIFSMFWALRESLSGMDIDELQKMDNDKLF